MVQRHPFFKSQPVNNNDYEPVKNTGLASRLEKRRKVSNKVSQYLNIRFVVGYTAVVEHLFSSAKFVLSQNWWGMTTQIFECLLFVKFNQSFKDAQLVGVAVLRSRGRTGKPKYWDE